MRGDHSVLDCLRSELVLSWWHAPRSRRKARSTSQPAVLPGWVGSRFDQGLQFRHPALPPGDVDGYRNVETTRHLSLQTLGPRLVKEPGPLFAREAEVQTAKGSDAADRHRDSAGHAGQDSPVEQDPATGYLANIDKLLGSLVPRSAPTEP